MTGVLVSVAAYRDPELVETVSDAVRSAAAPAQLRFCVAWQHGPEADGALLRETPCHSTIDVIDIPFEQSRGVCWARSEIQKRYDGEDYYLQLDSHHRFCPGWDERLLDYLHYLQAVGYRKPVLSGYLPPYSPENDPAGRADTVYAMHAERFLPEGVAFLRPHEKPGWRELQAPFPSRFVSGHFIFTLGSFVSEVPYDPELYFHGEETALAARAYTHGYDFFTPHRPLIWHEYGRHSKRKHWDDQPAWHIQNEASYRRYRTLFRVGAGLESAEAVGRYGFGTQRSLREYEEYAGLDFTKAEIRARNSEPEIVRGGQAPLRLTIRVPKDALPETDYDFLAVAFLDSAGVDVYREDCSGAELERLRAADPGAAFLEITRTFTPNAAPKMWRVWPHSRSKGWQDRLEHPIAHAGS